MARLSFRNIFARANRGVLLDVVVFVLNLFLMRLLTGYFVSLFRRLNASEGDASAEIQLGLFCVGMFVLPAAGAILKRRDFHRRRAARRERAVGAEGKGDDPSARAWGCLVNPVTYLAVSLVISAGIVSLLGPPVFGQDITRNGAIFVPLILGAMAASILQTYFVYHYFTPPKRAPGLKFLSDPRSALLGDVCIYVNMILFQILWNTLTLGGFTRVTSLADFAGRLFFLCFVAMLVYFPPRVFYLAEDARRRSTWLTMLLANSPVIIRVLVGVKPGVGG
ncbi:MAG: hypothetical protein LC746_00120 [Acidobacteria bacterium]|nr:hypothetical protein [Acidobacteriota bacterium]